MKRLVPLFLIALLAVVLPVAAAETASAQDTVYVTPAAAAGATDIVNGRIVSTVSVDLDGDAHRVSEVEITGTQKGELTGSVLVETPGGERADGAIVFVSHTPELVPGALVQLALAATPGTLGVGLSAAVNPDLDVYSVVNGIDGASGLAFDDGGGALGVGDYSLTGVSWPDFAPSVVFKVNTANSGIGSSDTIAGVQRAFQLWEDAPESDVDFTYGGTTTKVGVNLNDSQNTVSWVNSSSTWLAQASWVAVGGGEILGFDVQVNRRYSWANGGSGGRYDIGTVVAHEVGHGIGFNHVEPSSELMHYQITQGTTKGLGSGDRSGAAFLYPTAVPPQITSPSNGATLSCAATTLNWSGPRNGQYIVHAGSYQNAADYVLASAGSNLSYTMTGLPSDGSLVYVRLWFKPTGGSWGVEDTAVYTVCGAAPSVQIASPANGATLSCGSATLQWQGGTNGVYVVHAGSYQNAADYVLASAGSSLSYTMTGLPSDGSLVYVRLWFKPTGGSWGVEDTAVYTVCGAAPSVQIASPANGATLSCGSATLQWQGGTNGVYVVHAGSYQNAADYVLASAGSSLSYTMTGLPSDGSLVYVRLWFKPTGGSWGVEDTAVYTVCGAAPSVQIASPANGATLSCGSATLQWQGGTNGVYVVHAGSYQNAADYVLASAGSSLSYTMTGLPSDGSLVYVRLWFKPTGGAWQVEDSAVYTAC